MKPLLLTAAIAVSLPATVGYGDHDFNNEFDAFSRNNNIQSSYSTRTDNREMWSNFSAATGWDTITAQATIPLHSGRTDNVGNRNYLLQNENNEREIAETDKNQSCVERTTVVSSRREENREITQQNKTEYDISNADYAKLYTMKIKTDKYYQKEYSSKAKFAKEVGELYQDWDLNRHFFEATGKTEELKELDAEMNAKLTVLKAENTANNYELDNLFSADASSSNKELFTAWQNAKETAADFEEAASEKETKSANDTYLKNYYTKQAVKDREREADAAAKREAFHNYLKNR